MIASAVALAVAAIVLLTGGRLLHVLRPASRRVERSAEPEQPRRRRLAFDRRVRRQLATAVVGVLALVAVGPIGVIIIAVAPWMWKRYRSAAGRRRRQADIDAAVPDAIELLVLLIHAGLTPHQAVSRMTHLAPESIAPGFRAVDARLSRGRGLADSVGALTETLGPALATVADTLAIAVRHGTPIAGVLDQLSSDVRLRRRRFAEAEARKLPVRLSFPLVVCTLPSFVLVAIAPAVLATLSSLTDTSW